MSDRKSRAPRGDWRNLPNQAKAANGNPYAGVNMNTYNNSAPAQHRQPPEQDQSLTPDNIDRAKVHRRFSVRLNGPPQLDFQHQPLPMNAQALINKNADKRQIDNDQSSKQHAKYMSIGNIYDDELSLLANPDFDAHTFVQENLSSANAVKIDEFSKKLSKLSLQVDDNIKDTISKSLENLSKTSKEFNETESEIKNLKTIFNELNEIVQNMKETADLRIAIENTSSTQDNKRRDRSSILVVQKLWDKELQSLFNHVAGAQQLITAIPGRHVLAESGRWMELSPTTLKPLQAAHIFILNDHILIASNRRQNDDSGNGSKYNKSQNLIANQCWPLREVKLFNVKSQNPDSSLSDYHTIKIVSNSSTYMYRTERDDHYKKIIDGYRKGKDELKTMMQDDAKSISRSGGGSSVVRTASQINNRRSVPKERRTSGILSKTHQRTQSYDAFSSDTVMSTKLLDDNIDKLDIEISRKHFNEAVTLLKQIEKDAGQLGHDQRNDDVEGIIAIVDNLRLRLKKRRDLIVDQLKKSLGFSATMKSPISDIGSIIGIFSQLDIIDVGRDYFLTARDSLVNTLISKVEINGSVPNFITQISIIRFQVIKSTIEVYQTCFHGDDESSFLVDWCYNQVRSHARFLEQQLNGTDQTSLNYIDCLKVTKIQSQDLKKMGIDVDFLLNRFYNSI